MNLLYKIEQLSRIILRKIARTIVRFPAKWYFNHQFKKAFTPDYDSFWVVDIDNTIADSWKKMTPQYENAFRSESDRIMSFEPFEPMQSLFKHIPPRTRIVFLSARQYIRYFVTQRWLKKHGFEQPDSVLILVERMKDKVPLIEGVVKKYFEKRPPQYKDDFDEKNALFLTNFEDKKDKEYPLIYFDDLSFNHENGDVLFYENVINSIKKLPIKYVDYFELLSMQNGENSTDFNS